ncbi:serine/threonine protein kinase [Calycomorphotria hydatis]|uniref:Serine/threonine-protein kinase PrkC n=1 Tax=Calycomorphotria hydatis TaxID=2528027 RepID=A0A517T9F7_9PLAN|nr:serine/threonine protein kinase [Calycomorphotria hydatis]QDT65012.1 Serine/threonine-protein kinase PrkC [Calycomorphotria hydatis]
MSTSSIHTEASFTDTPRQDEAQQLASKKLSLSRDVFGVHPPPGWTLVRRLGQGGYGDVWLARENRTGRNASVKYLHQGSADWALLSREVERLAMLDSSRNIVDLIDVGWEADPPYFIMEYLPQGSLENLLEQGPLDVDSTTSIARGVLNGLIHAHSSGILHCDLKPANVLMDAGGEPRLCDFGLSRLQEEMLPSVGTLFYMPPEQADPSAPPDVRWDIYAFGALCYEMLTGHPPHATDEVIAELNQCDTLARRLAKYREAIDVHGGSAFLEFPESVDDELKQIILRCLKSNPAERYPTAQAVQDALETRAQTQTRRPMLILGLIGPLLLLLAMTPFFVSMMRSAVSAARDREITQALDRNAMSVRLLAWTLEREFAERIQELEAIANEPVVRALVSEAADVNWDEESGVVELLSLRDYLEERVSKVTLARKQAGRVLDSSWFLCSAGEHRPGIQQWRLGAKSEVSLGHNYQFRDYYHGQGFDFDRDHVPDNVEAVEETYICQPYHSDSSSRYKVAISTPIRHPRTQQVIGILARSMYLGELLTDFREQSASGNGEGPHQVMAICDGRTGDLLDHPWFTPERLTKMSSEDFDKLQVVLPESLTSPSDFRELPKQGTRFEPLRLTDYQDPIDACGWEGTSEDNHWLAAFCPIRGPGWIAIVQERREEVVSPVNQMRTNFARFGVVGLLGGCGLIVLFWYFGSQALLKAPGRLSTNAEALASPSGTGATEH